MSLNKGLIRFIARAANQKLSGDAWVYSTFVVFALIELGILFDPRVLKISMEAVNQSLNKIGKNANLPSYFSLLESFSILTIFQDQPIQILDSMVFLLLLGLAFLVFYIFKYSKIKRTFF